MHDGLKKHACRCAFEYAAAFRCCRPKCFLASTRNDEDDLVEASITQTHTDTSFLVATPVDGNVKYDIAQ